MSSARSEAGKWLVLIVAATLILDWCLRVIAGLAAAVLPWVVFLALPVFVVVLIIQRRSRGGW